MPACLDRPGGTTDLFQNFVANILGKSFRKVCPLELKLSGISPARIKKAGYSEAEVKDMMVAPRLASSVTGFTPQVV